jgi:hypothetical protein
MRGSLSSPTKYEKRPADIYGAFSIELLIQQQVLLLQPLLHPSASYAP